jgi:eight-cysteine-cluster-containing protein
MTRKYSSGLSPILAIILIAIAALFVPIPELVKGPVLCHPLSGDREPSTPNSPCPLEGDIIWHPSVIQNLLSISKLEQAPKRSTMPSSTPAFDPTVNWKTYINTIYKFQFNYPESWTIIDGSTEKYYKTVELYNNKSGMTLYLPSNTEADEFKYKIIKKETMYFGSKPMIFNFYKAYSHNLSTSVTTYQTGAYSSELSREPIKRINFGLDPDREEENLQIIKQILSTFKFLDDTAASPEPCVKGGCSGQLCGEKEVVDKIFTDCMFRVEYECFAKTKCERQPDGRCGWTPNREYSQCRAKYGYND